jgi:hypothetical protein
LEVLSWLYSAKTDHGKYGFRIGKLCIVSIENSEIIIEARRQHIARRSVPRNSWDRRLKKSTMVYGKPLDTISPTVSRMNVVEI